MSEELLACFNICAHGSLSFCSPHVRDLSTDYFCILLRALISRAERGVQALNELPQLLVLWLPFPHLAVGMRRGASPERFEICQVRCR